MDGAALPGHQPGPAGGHDRELPHRTAVGPLHELPRGAAGARQAGIQLQGSQYPSQIIRLPFISCHGLILQNIQMCPEKKMKKDSAIV